MTDNFRLTFNKTNPDVSSSRPFSGEVCKQIAEFHSGIANYAPTPLVFLDSLAKEIGVEKLMVKNESFRFGLNAFKALGGSYAISAYLCERFGIPMDKNTYDALHTEEFAEKIKDITFITATDGNHGRGVAWYATRLGCEAYVYLPAGTAKDRLDNIRLLGAHAEITDMNYDDTVRFVEKLAKRNGWVLVQDTSWDGYEEIPMNVMKGYTTLASEIAQQIDAADCGRPTHVFLQAGVGSMAGAVAGYFTDLRQDDRPTVIVVEPDKADCLFRTADASDGKLHFVTGRMNSMMAGLCCGEPCPLAWKVLKDTASAFISCSDDYSAFAMKLLAHPHGTDDAIVSGESGAVTTGVAVKLMTDPALKEYKEQLGLDENSRILVISTEGNTDRENYDRIVNG